MPELSERIRTVVPSPISALADAARGMKESGRPVIDLTVGETGLPVSDEIRSEGIRTILLNETAYTANTGTEKLRKALAERFGVGPESIAVSNGAKTILSSLMPVLTDPGDEVILPAPYWSCFREMIRIAGAKEIILRCGPETDYLPDRAGIERSATSRTKAVIVNSPSNPAGTACTETQIREIAAWCADRGIFLLLDASYDELTDRQSSFRALSSFTPAERAATVYVSSASKSFAMSGWRIGWCVADPSVITSLAGVLTNCVGCPSAIAQNALLKGLETFRTAPGYIREACAERSGYVAARIQGMQGVSCPDPAGSLYVFVRLESEEQDTVFAEKLLAEQQVAVVPGSAFGLPGHLRIACTKPLPELDEAMMRLERFLSR